MGQPMYYDANKGQLGEFDQEALSQYNQYRAD